MSIWRFEHQPSDVKQEEAETMRMIYDFSDRAPCLPELPPDPIRYAVVQEDEGFVASCLNVDVASQGSTREEALENLREALTLYFSHREELAGNPKWNECSA